MAGKNRDGDGLSLEEFNQFVETRVSPHLRPVALRFWDLVAREAPSLMPRMRGGTDKYIPVPVWRLGRDVMALSPSSKALTVSFGQGASFADPGGHLGGAGKASRSLKLTTVDDLSNPSLASFLRQVVEQAQASLLT